MYHGRICISIDRPNDVEVFDLSLRNIYEMLSVTNSMEDKKYCFIFLVAFGIPVVQSFCFIFQVLKSRQIFPLYSPTTTTAFVDGTLAAVLVVSLM